jgi:phospholipase D1/2
MVYIAGWSMYHQVKLLRDTSRQIPEGGDLTLGEFLKRKSAEVCVFWCRLGMTKHHT